MSNLKGEVLTSNVPCIKVTWKIRNFSQASRKRKINSTIRSPPFSFAEASWNLILRQKRIMMDPDVSIRLERLNSPISAHSVIVRMSFKTDLGEEYGTSTNDFEDESHSFSKHWWYSERSLAHVESFLLPDETLTVFCELRLETQPRELSFMIPFRSDKSVDSTRGDQNIAENSAATHSAPDAFELLVFPDIEEQRPNSLENLVSNISEMQEFEGHVSTSNVPCIEVSWEIPNFVQTSRKIGYEVKSPAFFFAQASWCLELAPNGAELLPNCIIIGLKRLSSSVSSHSVIARMCFKTERGDKYRSFCTEDFVDENCDSLYHFYDERSYVERCDFLLPKGTATVFCQLRLKTQPRESFLELPVKSDGSQDSPSGNQNVAKNSGATHSAPSQLGLLNCSQPTHELHPNSGIHNFQSDFKKPLDSKEDSDVCLEVSVTKFRDHEFFLKTSSFFSHILKGDKQEKVVSGKLLIEDRNPEVVPDFLQHTYAGGVDTLSKKNVFILYRAADKYDMADLKSQCRTCMERTLSVDTFCDVMIVALRYKEVELLEVALNFFSKNLRGIITEVKFPKYVEEHDTEKELIIRAFVPPNEE